MACVYIFRHGKENKFKIGRTKNSANIRLKGLQTGNPDLTIFHAIETEYPTKIENYMHHRLATKKIINDYSSSDEFYAVSEPELQSIIAEASKVNSEYLPTIAQAEEVGAKEPDGSIKEPGNAAVAMHQELREIKEKMTLLESRWDYLVAGIQLDMDTASEVRGIATWKAVQSNRLNQAALKAEHPDIFQQYLSTSISRVFRLEI
jgi:hypothetical protein